ncbi:hypothetical protein DITRI_Ditri09bG0135300 [Diplodiscus trichospermus]
MKVEGTETRKKFTDHLYNALKIKGFVTFRDDQNLEAGKEIAPYLLTAIQESWGSVIVFSEAYASSSWCLEELAEIVKQKKERGHEVFPIFYHVDPSDLRKQKGQVEEAFAKHEDTYKGEKNKIQKWRSALTEVANVKGWHLEDSYESECIKDIVEKIYSVVPLIGSIFQSEYFMPSESSTSTFNNIINALNTNGVNMIGLYGMPGVAKTSLAKQVGKHAKEQRLFDNVVMVTMSQNPNIKIQDRIAESLRIKLETRTEEGKAEELQWRLKDMKKILIIIDDVWSEFKLQSIGIPTGVEHQGWKILLTMRLEKVCVQMDCQERFQLNLLSEDEAWALFKVMANLKVCVLVKAEGINMTLQALANQTPTKETFTQLYNNVFTQQSTLQNYLNNLESAYQDQISETKKLAKLISRLPKQQQADLSGIQSQLDKLT